MFGLDRTQESSGSEALLVTNTQSDKEEAAPNIYTGNWTTDQWMSFDLLTHLGIDLNTNLSGSQRIEMWGEVM